ncbi:MAG: hypothetical protein ABI904_16020 [Chloroflexota bacterium]
MRFNIKIFIPLLFWTLILCACLTSLPATDAGPLSPVTSLSAATEITPEILPKSPARPIPKIVQTLQTPHIDQPPNENEATITPASERCGGYQWAYRDLPDLSSKFLQAIQQLQPSAQAKAFAFGEDCFYADGHADFIAMETDFNITVQINDTTDTNECGTWVVKIMQVILDIPKEEIVGPRPGRVAL